VTWRDVNLGFSMMSMLSESIIFVQPFSALDPFTAARIVRHMNADTNGWISKEGGSAATGIVNVLIRRETRNLLVQSIRWDNLKRWSQVDKLLRLKQERQAMAMALV
jgi:hypothetical protein